MRILWIPHTGWHIPQRAHQFCLALAERHEIHVTDLIADFRRPGDYLSLRYLRNFTYRRRRAGPITVHGVPRISPAIYSRVLRRMNERLFSALVRWLIARYRIEVVVGTFVVAPPKAPRLIFDLFDDNVAYWRSYGQNMAYADEIAATEQAYLAQADAVVASTSVLAERARHAGAHGPIYQIPNGVATESYAQASGARLRATLAGGKPLVGMLGNHDREAELAKVLDAAAALGSDGPRFVIAGRGEALGPARLRVARDGLSHVRFLGYIPPDEAPALIAALDVGLCPYRKTVGADASSPMRLLMYAAAGVPTVCTDLEEVRRMAFSNVVLVDDTSAALAEGIRQALCLPRRPPAAIANYDLPKLITRYEQVLAGDDYVE